MHKRSEVYIGKYPILPPQ